MNAEELAREVGRGAAGTLEQALERIRHCVEQLRKEQIWWRPQVGLNSIGNLLLHLAGNLRQWVIAGLGDGVDTRDRPSEFSEQELIDGDLLLKHLEIVVREARQILENLSADQLLAARRIQGFDLTGIGAIFDSIPHFQGHTQEIISMTRMQLGDAYRFFWTPTTPEEGTVG